MKLTCPLLNYTDKKWLKTQAYNGFVRLWPISVFRLKVNQETMSEALLLGTEVRLSVS